MHRLVCCTAARSIALAASLPSHPLSSLTTARRAASTTGTNTDGTSSAAASSLAAVPGKVRVHIHSQVEQKECAVHAPVGLTLMEVIRDVARMDMEAACDGTCACSTCHVIFDEPSYKKLPDTPSEDEMDMLDLAPAVTKTSRLSCQVQMTPELDGINITIPDETENQMR